MKIIARAVTSTVVILTLLGTGTVSQAAAKIDINDKAWLSVGAGVRTSFSAVEDAAGTNNDSWSTDFALDNMRLYVNGKLNDYLGLEFNTECDDCPDRGEIRVLDAIVKFDLQPGVNIWVGRQLVPADRAELSGPYYQAEYIFDRTPFFPSDFGADTAGRFGRDDGINIWGALGGESRFTYVVGAFDGLDHDPVAGTPNVDDNLLWAGRVSYNFWEVEKNPGYYTSSTYYGTAGDVFTLGLAAQHQADAAGTIAEPGDFTGIVVDALLEKVLGGNGVVTLLGEYKDFDAGLTPTAVIDPTCFCLFEGDSWTATGLYLFPNKTGAGQIQPYVRYTSNNPDNSSKRDELEVGVNYVIDGHNARISLMYLYGDIQTKGRDWTPGVTGKDVSAIVIGLQLQI